MTSLDLDMNHSRMPGKVPLVKTEIPGSNSRKMLAAQENLETRSVIYPKSFPIAIARAFDSVIEDVDGNYLIDWVSGICVLGLGHSDVVKRALVSQLDRVWHALEIPTEARIEFLQEFRKSFPGSMQSYKTVFGISGADACETAINLAHVASGRGSRAPTIVFEGAYHGITGGIISATAGRAYKDPVFSVGFNAVRVPYPYKMWYNYDVGFVLSQLEKVVGDPGAGYDKPDSLLVEPILGEGGYVVPPIGFLKMLREFCDKNDIAMIVDEVQTGVGRTGKMWAFEWESVKPDIVCAGKAIGGGIPTSAVYYRGDMDTKLPTPFHLGTFRANPLALAAGVAVFREIPKFLDAAVETGNFLQKRFSSIGSPLVGEVRSRGSMVGVELVENGKPMSRERMLRIKHGMLRKGLMMHTCGHFGNVFRYMGALNIPREYVETGARIFEESLKAS